MRQRPACNVLAVLTGWCVLLGLAAACGLPQRAMAGETRVGIDLRFDRRAHDWALPAATKGKAKISYRFDSGFATGASVELIDAAFSTAMKANLEATVGYAHRINELLSVSLTVGLGERIRASSDGGSFPYYQATVAGSVKVTDKLTWHALSLRYRNAFDTANDFETPQISTGISYEVRPRNWLSLTLSQERKGDTPSAVGVQLGYEYGF